jgi:hypothetical protein
MTQNNGYSFHAYAAYAIGNIFQCWTEDGAHEPNVLETWEVYGCYLSNVNYGDLNYGSSEPVTVAMTLRFDNAVQTAIGSGVGADVGRSIGDNVS